MATLNFPRPKVAAYALSEMERGRRLPQLFGNTKNVPIMSLRYTSPNANAKRLSPREMEFLSRRLVEIIAENSNRSRPPEAVRETSCHCV